MRRVSHSVTGLAPLSLRRCRMQFHTSKSFGFEHTSSMKTDVCPATQNSAILVASPAAGFQDENPIPIS